LFAALADCAPTLAPPSPSMRSPLTLARSQSPERDATAPYPRVTERSRARTG